MRSLASIAGLGTLLFVAGGYGQTLSEHAAAAAGATIGTAAGKPVANALSGIMGQVDNTTATAAKTGAKAKAMTTTIAPEKRDPAAETNRAGGPGSFSPGFGGAPGPGDDDAAPQLPRPVARRRAAPVRAVPMPAVASAVGAPAVVAEPVKEPSLEEVASVKLGTTENDLFAALGMPESRVIVPDDDGHMRESCQYWARGRHLGTIRLDNGQVVRVEVRAGN